MEKHSREEIEKMVKTFVKRGNFETAAAFAQDFGDIDLAIEYMESSKKFENKNKREIFYQGLSATKEILKEIIYFNTYRKGEVPQKFPYANYHFLQERELDLKKN
jgi:NADH:ubiquinone oxidoreductase subunit